MTDRLHRRPTRSLAALLALAAGVGGAVWFSRRGGDEEAAVVPNDLGPVGVPARPGGAPPLPVDSTASNEPLPRVEPEAIGDGREWEATDRPPPTLGRRTLTRVAGDGTADGKAIRGVLLSFEGLVVRFRTEADRATFLEARFAVPPLACLPADDPPGAEPHEWVDAIRQAGFDVVWRLPAIVIGARSGATPPPLPPPSAPTEHPPDPRPGAPEGPR